MRVGRSAWFIAGFVTALVLTVGGAYAATGGTFILGQANSADAESKLKNKNGTPLALVAKAGTAPLTVNTGVKVQNLNSDRLDNLEASALQRRITGTCAVGSAVRVVKAGGGVTCQDTQVQSLAELDGVPCTTHDGAGTTVVVIGARTASGGGQWIYPVSTVCSVPWPPEGTTCDDGDPTTSDDKFTEGECHGTPPPVDCDDGDPYTLDTFDAGSSSCTNTPQPLDRDGDTFTAEQELGGEPDCNDADPAVHPAAPEIIDNAMDDDCDGLTDQDDPDAS